MQNVGMRDRRDSAEKDRTATKLEEVRDGKSRFEAILYSSVFESRR